MIFRFRSLALVVAWVGYAHAAMSGDEKSAPVLLGSIPASAWSHPALVTAPSQTPAKPGPSLASFLPTLPSSYFADASGSSRLLFLSPLSPLRGVLRVAAQSLAAQTLTAFEVDPPVTTASDGVIAGEIDPAERAAAASRRREVLLRQRRKSVLNERERGVERSNVAEGLGSSPEASGLSGRVELMTLPAGATPGQPDSPIPGGSGLVRVSGYLTDDLSFALTGLAADSAATTWRAGAEFALSAGERNTIEVGAVYGTRFNATNAPVGDDVERRSVGAFRLVDALKLSENVTTRVGGRFIDAPFLRAPRSVDPEFSVLIADAAGTKGGGMYLRFDVSGDTLFPGLEVVTGGSDVIALAEGLPLLSGNFKAQHTWNRGGAVGYHEGGTRVEARLQDQAATDALIVIPSSLAGAPLVENGRRNRVQVGSVLFEKTFARGQAQTSLEYGYGRFAADAAYPGRARDFHQITTRFDAYLRRSGTGIAIFHRFHEGAGVTSYEGDSRPPLRAQRYLVELRQDVPWVPALIGADLAFLLSLRNVYYDDVDRRAIDEFAVSTPPRRVTGGIRVKF
jgi:hypothetical protein